VRLLLPESPVEECIVYRVTVGQKNNAQVFLRLFHPYPHSDPSIPLNLRGHGVGHGCRYPFYPDNGAIWPIPDR
jgi:hypothetical protein